MGNVGSDEGSILDTQCCATRGVRDRMVDCGQEVRGPPQESLSQNGQLDEPSFQIEESSDLYGVGLVFRTTREGKLVVSSFIRDSSAFECGLVRDGGIYSPFAENVCTMPSIFLLPTLTLGLNPAQMSYVQ